MESFLSHIPFRGKPPLFLSIRSSTWFILTVVCIAIFTDIFLYGVVVPVIPFALKERANVPAEDVQHWVSVLLAVYSAAFFVSAPVWGCVADRVNSRRATLLMGLVVLIGATLMLCLGRSIGLLVAGRVVQGCSAGLVWTVALALLSDTVSNDDSGTALGYVAIAYSLGFLVAPFLGGIVYNRSGYYAVFAMTFGVLALDIILRVLIIEKKSAAKWLPQVGVAGEEADQEEGIEQGTELGPIATQSLTTEAEKTTATAFSMQSSKPKRKLPAMLILLKSRRILAAFWGNFVAAVSMTAFDTTLPLYVNKVFGWDSLGAGLIFIALIVPSFAGPVIGHLTDKYGPRWMAAAGLIMALPIWVLLRLVDHDNIQQIVLLCALLVLMGIAVALVLTSLMTEFSKVCDAKEKQQPGLFGHRSAYAQSYGIFNCAWAAGSLVGPLWAAGVEARGGWKTMTWTLGLLNGLSALPVLFYSGGLITRPKAGGHRDGDGSG